MEQRGKLDVVLGTQRGDEGKGRIVDYMAQHTDIVARGNGGANAGHTISINELTLALHQVPSGIAHPDKLNIIGNGVLLDPIRILTEIGEIQAKNINVTPDNLAISEHAALVLPHHILLDHRRETGVGRQGSTVRGIAFAAADKYVRETAYAEMIALDPDELLKIVYLGLKGVIGSYHEIAASHYAYAWVNRALELKNYIQDTRELLNSRLALGATALAEGAQAFLLDIEHGPAPYVTSSHTTTAGLLNGLGVRHQYLDRVVGVAKVVKSHVGEGPFMTEITDPILANRIRGPVDQIDSEYGKSTKRPRRVGHFDLAEIRQAIQVNGITELALTKLDHLKRYGNTACIAVGYRHRRKLLKFSPDSVAKLQECTPEYVEMPLWEIEDISHVQTKGELPKEAKGIISFIENETNTKVTMIGVGPARDQLITTDI